MAKRAKNMTIIAVVTAVVVFSPIGLLTSRAETNNPYRIAYQVQPGDTLKSISKNNGLDWELVAAMNNLNKEAGLFAGQIILLPREPEMTYTIKAGDTLWDIAKFYQIELDFLIKYNQVLRPSRLQIGEIIKIPVDYMEREEPVRLAAKETIRIASRGSDSFILPVTGVISCPYGWRKSGFHHGTDIAAATGTPIFAVKQGTVLFSGWRPIYGYTVMIDHGNNIKTLYGHASKLLVKAGQTVRKGQIIAKVGSTGRTTGPHVHFEVYVNGKTVDPVRYLPKL